MINTGGRNNLKKRRQSAWVPNDNIVKFDVGSMTPEEIELKMKELYQKVDGVWRCLACDYTSSHSSHQVRRHIETHLDGLSYTCNACNKEFRTKPTLDEHNRKWCHIRHEHSKKSFQMS